MKIFIVGANGAVGKKVIAQSLAIGHSVTAFVRNTKGLEEFKNLNIVKGSVADDYEVLQSAITGHDAVISALGNHLWLKGRKSVPIMEKAFSNIVSAMHHHSIRKFATVIAWGTGASYEKSNLFVKLIVNTLIKSDFKDFTAAEKVLAESQLDWTLGYFGALTDDVSEHLPKISTELKMPKPASIPRGEIARFLLHAVTNDGLAQKRVALTQSGNNEK